MYRNFLLEIYKQAKDADNRVFFQECDAKADEAMKQIFGDKYKKLSDKELLDYANSRNDFSGTILIPDMYNDVDESIINELEERQKRINRALCELHELDSYMSMYDPRNPCNILIKIMEMDYDHRVEALDKISKLLKD